MAASKMLSGQSGFEEFADRVGLDGAERASRRAALEASFMPFLCTAHYAETIAEQAEPYRTQMMNIVLPPPGTAPYRGRFDPYGNVSYKSDDHVFLQHKYSTTLLLHFVDVCLSNCQFCYKVNEIRHENSSQAQTGLKITAALKYVDSQPTVNNILFTGGDPAVVKPAALGDALRRLLAGRVRERTPPLPAAEAHLTNDDTTTAGNICGYTDSPSTTRCRSRDASIASTSIS